MDRDLNAARVLATQAVGYTVLACRQSVVRLRGYRSSTTLTNRVVEMRQPPPTVLVRTGSKPRCDLCPIVSVLSKMSGEDPRFYRRDETRPTNKPRSTTKNKSQVSE